MRLLLDTHALLWSLDETHRLPAGLSELLVSSGHVVFVSAVATWEAAIKAAVGRLDYPSPDLAGAIAQAGFHELPITIAHSLEVRHLPPIHRDPFDRLLIAQARHEGLTLVARDPVFRRYPVDVLWD